MTDEPLFRPLITVIRLTPDRSRLEVTLDLGGWISIGTAAVHDDDTITAAGVATCEAVQRMMPPGVEIGLAWCEHITTTSEDRREVVHSSVTVSGGSEIQRGPQDEELLGAAFVRSDPQVAAVRATLDGLTRRLARYTRGD